MSSRVDEVTELLGAEICAEVLATGAALTADSIQARTGASRGVVREALGVLVSLGLVRVRRRIGYEVRASTEWTVLSPEVMRWRLAGPHAASVRGDLGAMRGILEPAGAELAATTAPSSSRAAIAGAAGEMWTAAADGREDAFIDADMRFHRAILSASGNTLIAALGDILAESLPPRTREAGEISMAEARAHLDLADAIVRGDPAEAHRVAAAIVRGS